MTFPLDCAYATKSRARTASSSSLLNLHGTVPLVTSTYLELKFPPPGSRLERQSPAILRYRDHDAACAPPIRPASYATASCRGPAGLRLHRLLLQVPPVSSCVRLTSVFLQGNASEGYPAGHGRRLEPAPPTQRGWGRAVAVPLWAPAARPVGHDRQPWDAPPSWGRRLATAPSAWAPALAWGPSSSSAPSSAWGTSSSPPSASHAAHRGAAAPPFGQRHHAAPSSSRPLRVPAPLAPPPASLRRHPLDWGRILSREAALTSGPAATSYDAAKQALAEEVSAFLQQLPPSTWALGLRALGPPTLLTCSGRHIRLFLISGDARARYVAHRPACPSTGQQPPRGASASFRVACACPRQCPIGSLQTKVGKLQTIF